MFLYEIYSIYRNYRLTLYIKLTFLRIDKKTREGRWNMMVFALLGVNQNKINNVLSTLRGLGEKYVNKVHLVYGEYDIIAEIKAHNPDVSSNILRVLKETEGVNSLKTYVVSDQLTDDGLIKATIPPEPW